MCKYKTNKISVAVKYWDLFVVSLGKTTLVQYCPSNIENLKTLLWISFVNTYKSRYDTLKSHSFKQKAPNSI